MLFKTFLKLKSPETTAQFGLRMTADESCKVECYRIVKALMKKHWSSPKMFSSYLLKTLMLWASERNGEKHWKRENITECFLGLIDDILHSLVNGSLPQYFVPSHNMLEDTHVDFLYILARKVSHMRKHLNLYIETCLPKTGPSYCPKVKITYSKAFVEDSEATQMKMLQRIGGKGQQVRRDQTSEEKESDASRSGENSLLTCKIKMPRSAMRREKNLYLRSTEERK
jgi:hypothetical protein